jgi:cyanophycinase
MRTRALLLTALLAVACHTTRAPRASLDTGFSGSLLVIGGGLDNDNRPVYERFLELASEHGEPHIVVVTAATGPQEEEATDKREALRTWAPGVDVAIVRRETSTEETVAAIDRATALFFTGGDQARITARYRSEGVDTPECAAMRRLLERGGVIAGASAGDAMMGELMILEGRSAPALGISPEPDPAASFGEAPVLGPQFGLGMGFLPWGLTDSHFFERDRIGRLVAALEASGTRLGIAVGEDACVEIDLATGTLTGVSVSESLVIDAAHLKRSGLSRTGLVGRVVAQGDQLSLLGGLTEQAPEALPAAVDHEVPIAEPGQNRQLASWRVFRQASVPGSGVWRLGLDGYAVLAHAASGHVAFDLLVGP